MNSPWPSPFQVERKQTPAPLLAHHALERCTQQLLSLCLLHKPRQDLGLDPADQAGRNAVPKHTPLVMERSKMACNSMLLASQQLLPTACVQAHLGRCSKAKAEHGVLFISTPGLGQHTETLRSAL